MTDSEIIKAFQLCTLKAEHPGFILCGQIVDLINRLQAEVERLGKDSNRLKKVEMQLDDMCKMYNVIKAEAYKEFAEWFIREYPETEYFVSNLLKEMVGENNA